MKGVRTVLVAAAFAIAGNAFAQSDYPNRPVRIVVPTTPSGGSDLVARLLAPALSERWGKQVVVDNRAGAGTAIGSELVAKAPADGYTLLMGLSTLAINPALYAKVPYDAVRDFAPVTQAVFVPHIIIVHPSLPVKSVADMIALAKARPGQILFASAGYGTNQHLAMELFSSMAQIRLLHVPYKGTSPAIIDLIAGQVAIMAPSMVSALPHVRSGRLRALGVTSARRVTGAPDIPTIAESGLPGYDSVQWIGLLAPTGTPREIVARLYRESVSILRAPESVKRLASEGAEVVASTPDEFAAFIKTETVKWAKVAQAAGIRPE